MRTLTEKDLKKVAVWLHGKAKKIGVKPSDVRSDQLQKGIKIEKEHTDKPQVAKTIALDHLAEIPDYYQRLDKMEAQAKTAGHMDNNVVQGEAEHDKETKNKPAKKKLEADDVKPRGEGPWEAEGSPENVGETYKDLATKRAYLEGFTARCASHGVTPEDLFQVTSKMAAEFTPASPDPCAFKEQGPWPKADKKEKQEQNENRDKRDTRGSRHQEQVAKKENGPDVLKARISGGGAVRSDGQ